MKEWYCVQLDHHNRVAHVIMEQQKAGWRLHTYHPAGFGTAIVHYLLFERESPLI